MAEIKFEVIVASQNSPEFVTEKVRDALLESGGFELVSVGRVDEEDVGTGLPRAHLNLLKKFYVDFDVTSDRLAAQPGTLSEFTQRFNALVKSNYSAAVLVNKLINLRKTRKLPRLRKNTEGLGL